MEKIEDILYARFGKERVQEAKKLVSPRNLNILEVDGKYAVLRPLAARELSEYSMLVATPDKGLEAANRFLLSELWLFGDEEIRNDEELFMSAMLTLQNVVELKKSNFYKL